MLSATTTLSLPAYGWRCRKYQRPVWRFFRKGGKRAALAWHRRAGKDEFAMQIAACLSQHVKGTYWHMLPEAEQARKAIWEAVNPKTGRRRIDDAFPPEMREVTRNNEMFIRFRNGSTWQVVGSDNFNSLVGSPPIFVCFSEYSRANPAAWAYLRPILAENDGFALFISTFFGRNHFWKLVQDAAKWDGWFSEVLSADQTGVFTPEQLEVERAELVAMFGEEEGEALFNQEYLSDPSASVLGSYFGPAMAKVEQQGRITRVPHNPARLVYTAWDLGSNDVTAIWFAQLVGLEPRIIDYYQNNNQETAHYAEILKKRGYRYGGHFLPHDGGNQRVLKRSIQDELTDLGFGNVHATRRAKDSDELLADINLGRQLIGKAVFDGERCEVGLDALRSYRREWDDKLKTFRRTPLHDWASDPADAWRTLAVNWPMIEAESAGAFDMTGWHDAPVA